MPKALTVLCLVIFLLTVLAVVGIVASDRVQTEEIDLRLSLPAPVRIAHVSDVHAPRSFLSLEDTASLVAAQKPDCVVLTGDILDGEGTKEDVDALAPFFSALSARCPCFLVIGNHEIGNDHLQYFISVARDAGVCVLQNETVTRTINGVKIAFLGLSDGYAYESATFSTLPDGTEDARILLSHRPEKFSSYVNDDALRPDVVFAGHAHGGIARIGKTALYAPDQGLFPSYTSGVYTQGDVSMIVSRGLGVSGVDFRWFDRYHLPVITLS